jgi:hypothetical protein
LTERPRLLGSCLTACVGVKDGCVKRFSDEPPANMRHCPVDPQSSLPVPQFANRSGRVDLGSVNPSRLASLVRARQCPTCGRVLELDEPWAVLGGVRSWEMLRFASEPIGHRACIAYALQACPWLHDATWTSREPLVLSNGEDRRSDVWILGEAPEVRLETSSWMVSAPAAIRTKCFAYEEARLQESTQSQAAT